MGAPELIHVATMKAQLGEQLVAGAGAMGMRVIAEVDSVTVTGDRLNASMAGKSAADWLTIGHDGSYGNLDVRVTLRTDDDEVIYLEYGGKIADDADRLGEVRLGQQHSVPGRRHPRPRHQRAHLRGLRGQGQLVRIRALGRVTPLWVPWWERAEGCARWGMMSGEWSSHD